MPLRLAWWVVVLVFQTATVSLPPDGCRAGQIPLKGICVPNISVFVKTIRYRQNLSRKIVGRFWSAPFEARRLLLSPSGRERRAIAFDGAPGRACADSSQERMDKARKVAAVKDMRCDSRAPRRFDVAAGRANEERSLAQDRPFGHGLEEKG
jgi:hypothetical protein